MSELVLKMEVNDVQNKTKTDKKQTKTKQKYQKNKIKCCLHVELVLLSIFVSAKTKQNKKYK